MPGTAPHELVTTGNSKRQKTQNGLCGVWNETLNLGSNTSQTQAIAGSGAASLNLGMKCQEWRLPRTKEGHAVLRLGHQVAKRLLG